MAMMIPIPDRMEGRMPSKSPEQKRLMAAAAHDAKFAAKAGVPQKVAREFNKADQKKAAKPKGSSRGR
jgi:hypothetical protein